MRAAFVASLLGIALVSCGPRKSSAHGKRVIVLGVDAMDPRFLERHWDSLPNLKKLRDTGGFTRLATTTPPQSPVAWSTFITGTDPEQHGIFDFVLRDPSTGQVLSSLGETVESAHRVRIGPYSLPLSKSHVRNFHSGRPFWELLDENNIPVTMIHMPTNFPPMPHGQALSGMGTPDLEGTYGTFTYYTDDPMTLGGTVSGGRVVKIQAQDHRVVLPIDGPHNTLRRDRLPARLDLVADIDPDTHVLRARIGDQQFILKQGEWSAWIPLRFTLIPGLAHMPGMFRLYAKEFDPYIRIYLSPLNSDPADPALPISYPKDYASHLANRIGRFYTQGIPEDTSALRQNALSLDEYLAQSRLVAADDDALLDDCLKSFRDGLLFFYFSEVDQDSHMLWDRHETELLRTYRHVDSAIGRVLSHADGATIMVMSDHGFASFDRSINLNTWLAEQDYLRFNGSEIDWSATKAYALGLNALYVNLSGRERNGIVQPGAQRDSLLDQISSQLRELRDPASNQPMIASVFRVPASSNKFAPDLIVGYSPGYRASWETALGEAPPGVVRPNTDAWIGDHCMAAVAVPGVLLSNHPIQATSPRLKDLTVTLLKEFNVPASPAMSGTPVY